MPINRYTRENWWAAINTASAGLCLFYIRYMGGGDLQNMLICIALTANITLGIQNAVRHVMREREALEELSK